MSRPILLQLFPVAPHPLLDQLDQTYDRQLLTDASSSPDLAAIASRVELLLTSATTPTPASLIDQLPALKGIASIGVGYDAIDVKFAQDQGLPVSNTPDVLNDCVADLAWSLILATCRQIPQADQFARSGLWTDTHHFPSSQRVSGKKLGIVGLGRIGLSIAERGLGFKMDIRYHNRHPRPDVTWPYADSLQALAKWADILVIATVGGPHTRNLIDLETLQALGPTGVLINISRGSVVDQHALQQALESGDLGAAGLDVFDDEPHIPQGLKALPQIVLTPHIASATKETRHAMLTLALENLVSMQKTGRCLTPITL